MDLAAWLERLEQLHPSAIDLGLARCVEVARRLELFLTYDDRPYKHLNHAGHHHPLYKRRTPSPTPPPVPPALAFEISTAFAMCAL